MSPDDAVEAGALALFGEKYGEEVRVLSMGSAGDEGKFYSVELCGGTHVNATGDIQLFRIINESAVSSGVRRIEALTGEAARQWFTGREDALKSAASLLRTTPEDVAERIEALLAERKILEKELAGLKKQVALGGSGGSSAVPSADETIDGITFSGQVIEGLNPKDLRGLLDEAKTRMGSGIAAAVAVNDGRAAIAVAVTDDLTDSYDAVELVRAGVEALGGKGGGGRADMAQGGGPEGRKADKALNAVRSSLAG